MAESGASGESSGEREVVTSSLVGAIAVAVAVAFACHVSRRNQPGEEEEVFFPTVRAFCWFVRERKEERRTSSKSKETNQKNTNPTLALIPPPSSSPRLHSLPTVHKHLHHGVLWWCFPRPADRPVILRFCRSRWRCRLPPVRVVRRLKTQPPSRGQAVPQGGHQHQPHVR